MAVVEHLQAMYLKKQAAAWPQAAAAASTSSKLKKGTVLNIKAWSIHKMQHFIPYTVSKTRCPFNPMHQPFKTKLGAD